MGLNTVITNIGVDVELNVTISNGNPFPVLVLS